MTSGDITGARRQYTESERQLYNEQSHGRRGVLAARMGRVSARLLALLATLNHRSASTGAVSAAMRVGRECDVRPITA